jgi:N-acetyl-anhydromuramyl-L-alanine amidase AmpD
MIPDRIVIHHSLTADSGTVSWQAIRRYHVETNGWRAIGYHFGVELVGSEYEVLAGRMLNEVGAHTAGHNATSIGICLVGNFDAAPPPDAQMEKAAALVRALQEVLRIPRERVTRHADHAAKSCPGGLFPWDSFRALLRP